MITVTFAALIGGGIVTGLLLSKYCPKRDRLQPIRLFIYSPIIYYAFYIKIITGHSDMPEILPTIGYIGAGMFISWIGALIGWGVYYFASKHNNLGTPNTNLNKG